MEDNQIVELYWKKDGEAIRKSEEVYGAYCFSVAYNILRCQEDSEECVNDTWLHAWNSIPPQRPKKLKYFLAKITRNLSIDRYRALAREKRDTCGAILILDELGECVNDTGDVENELIASELNEAVQSFIRKLPEREGNIFVRRYFYSDQIHDISVRYNITENYVMVVLCRTRKKLKAYLQKEGFLNE